MMLCSVHERGERGIGLLIIGSGEIFIFQIMRIIRILHDFEVFFIECWVTWWLGWNVLFMEIGFAIKAYCILHGILFFLFIFVRICYRFDRH